MQQDCRKAEKLVAGLEKEATAGLSMRTERERKRLELLVEVLRELMASDDTAMRRTMGWISELVFFSDPPVDDQDEALSNGRDLHDDRDSDDEEEADLVERVLRLSLEDA